MYYIQQRVSCMVVNNMSQFDDIRPFNDDEVAPTIARLLETQEFTDAVAKLRFPRLAPVAPWLLRPIVRWVLGRQLAGVHRITQVQEIVAKYLNAMIDKRVTALTFSGLDKLDPAKPYLFISNHRDIAMDPALVNNTLFQNGFDTLRIAIGDNLLTKPFVSDLMRINKSFIVNRSATAPREKFKAAKHLSAYIHHSIVEDRSNLWIAQREGRAKDGLDKTNTAIVSMLALSKPKPQAFADYIRELNIVPVSISYEWDPCDKTKANELYQLQDKGSYEKAEHEDIASIAAGISGEKGCIHITFGDQLQGDYENADDVAKEIDRQVWDNYVQQASNHLAYFELNGHSANLPLGANGETFDPVRFNAQKQELQRRLAEIPEAQRELFLGIYANPILSQLRSK